MRSAWMVLTLALGQALLGQTTRPAEQPVDVAPAPVVPSEHPDAALAANSDKPVADGPGPAAPRPIPTRPKITSALAPTTRPAADHPSLKSLPFPASVTALLPPSTRPATAAKAGLPSTQPAVADLARLQKAAETKLQSPPGIQTPAATVSSIGKLSGNPVEIEVTSDGTLVMTGDENDLAILEAFINLMDQQPLFKPEFKIFKLKSGDAGELATKIEQLWNNVKKPTSGQLRPEDRLAIIPEPRANLLMIAATEANMELITTIVEGIDQPSLSGTVKFEPVQLKYIKAGEAEQKLKDILKSLAQRKKQSADLFTILADARTNMLLISAPADDLEQIKNLISLMDVEPTAESGAVVKVGIYPLEKAVAKDLADALTKMLERDSDDAKAIKEQIRRLQVVRKGPDGSDKQLSDLDLDKPIKIFGEVGTNSIIVATTEKNLGPMGEIIHLLDTAPIADAMVVKVIPLEHADADALMASLKAIFEEGKRLPEQPGKTVAGRMPPDVIGQSLAYNIGFSADKRTNTLVVSGRPEQILLVQQIVKSVDIEQTVGQYTPKLVTLAHADVKTVAEGVQKLIDQQQKVAEKTLSPTAAERERSLIIPDTRTNSLIIVAKEDKFEELSKLVRDLDEIKDTWLGAIQIITLDNLAATDVAEKIKEIWDGRAEARRQGGLKEDKPVIVSDTRSNALVVASTPDDFVAIQDLVQKLEAQKVSPMADIRSITLVNNDVTKVAEIVRKLFTERLKQSLAKGQEEQPSDRITVIEDALSRTMLVASSKTTFEEVKKLVAQLDVPPSAEGVFRTFPVRNADISKAAKLVTDLFDKGLYIGSGDKKDLPESATKVTVVPDVRSSSLVVSASPQNLAIVESLLKEIDREDIANMPADAKFFKIKYADVVSLADTLQQMFKGMQAGMGSDQKDQLEVTIIPDTRSKALIVTGARFAIKRAEELVPKLDVETSDAAYTFKVYTLKEAAASKLEPVMTEMFQKRSAQGESSKRTPINIIADDQSNSLVITASMDDHQMAQHLISLLDRKSTIAEQMEIFPLADAKAKTISETLTKLIEQQQGKNKGGFAVTPEERTNALIVWANPALMENVRTIIGKLDNTRVKTEMGLRVFRLRNAKAEDLSKQLDDFFQKAGSSTGKQSDDAKQMIIKFLGVDPKTGEERMRSLVYQDVTITPDKNTNSLMVLAPEEHIEMLRTLVEMLDSVEPQTADLMVFPLRNSDAKEIQNLLEDLFKSKSGSSDGSTPLLVSGGAAAEGGAGAAVELTFSVDERTNSLIAAGSPAYLRIVENLVYKLDYQEVEERVQRVIQLRNRTSEDVAAAMKAFFDEEKQAMEAAQKGEAASRQLMRQVTIQEGGKGSNTLVVSYNPRMESQVVAMVNELDRAPAQVMIQVLMAEVTISDNFELGMEFALQDLVFSENKYTGPNGVVQGEGFDKILGTSVGAVGQSGGRGISFTVTGEDFDFLFHALQAEGQLEVLSRPSIMVQDNQDAEITIGQRVPTVQDVVVSSSGVVTPSVTYEKVGVILKVTPIVNADGYVNLEVSPEVSQIGQSPVTISTGVSLPTFDERSAKTTVTVKNGETVIIGGLITSNETKSESKVPLVGDIPGIGNLFRASTRKTSRTELIIMLTPHVIRTPEEARTLSVEMRDQTGLNDNIRRSPLMQGLQVKPDADQFGPVDVLRPTGEQKKRSDEPADQFGPEVEQYGPPVSAIQTNPERPTLTVRVK
ncbi:MAG TPA: secretin N-terminal domain-containing protein [Phycisphaerae bacterium]|nr:secretin N-terminal domain-containing protein [Phycisphaerae bacterium]HRY69698.1 secretin N-terminal domain-containing protein [Phycisphaerae bacterium]HSA25105.1 secretin N-terminal domain-containing protein [Phycisphaerae bacterium]